MTSTVVDILVESSKLAGKHWIPMVRSQLEHVCVFVHPWGILGGSSRNTEPYAQILSDKYGVECITFDLRGVGESHGSVTLRCHSEVADVVSVCMYVKKELNRPIVLVGSSAGAAIAGSALDKMEEIVGYVGIGYTFGWVASWMFGGHFDGVIKSMKPKLFIMGTKDEFTTVSQLEKRIKSMHNCKMELIDGVGHFELETRAYAKVSSELVHKFMKGLGQ